MIKYGVPIEEGDPILTQQSQLHMVKVRHSGQVVETLGEIDEDQEDVGAEPDHNPANKIMDKDLQP